MSQTGIQNIDAQLFKQTILPGATIGILGGGQLGRMIALKAREMGYRIVTMDPSADSPCGQVADVSFVSSLDDLSAAKEMAKQSDVLTYEFENVNDTMVRILEQEAFLPQGGNILHITRHRIREKTFLESIGVPVAPWKPVVSLDDLKRGVFDLGFPSVLKTSTGGYDGKGQYVLRTENDIETAWERLGQTFQETGQGPGNTDQDTDCPGLVLEAWVHFDKEISIIAARNQNGEIRTFPTAHNIYQENILHQSIVPAGITKKSEYTAQELAIRITEKMNVIGLIAIEMFLKDENIFVNELAPRPHNSGHYTMDACVTSQFEQHVRAICNLPLGDTRLLSPVVMVNILGQHLQPVLDKASILGDQIKLHLYGKTEARAKRKMGHLNILAPSTEEALKVIDQLGIWK